MINRYLIKSKGYNQTNFTADHMKKLCSLVIEKFQKLSFIQKTVTSVVSTLSIKVF